MFIAYVYVFIGFMRNTTLRGCNTVYMFGYDFVRYYLKFVETFYIAVGYEDIRFSFDY